MANLRIVDSRTTHLKLESPDAGVGLKVTITDAEVRSIYLRVDKHKNSGLPSEWDEIKIHGGLQDLEALRDFCDEMISEIEKRTTAKADDQFSLG